MDGRRGLVVSVTEPVEESCNHRRQLYRGTIGPHSDRVIGGGFDRVPGYEFATAVLCICSRCGMWDAVNEASPGPRRGSMVWE